MSTGGAKGGSGGAAAGGTAGGPGLDASAVDGAGTGGAHPRDDASVPVEAGIHDAAVQLDATGAPDAAVPDPCGPAPPAAPSTIAAHCTIGIPVTIDGNLSEWPDSLFTNDVRHQTGEPLGGWSSFEATNDKTLSGRFAVRWDTDALYLAAKIVDDVRATPDATHLYQNDTVELFLDGDDDRGAYSADDIQLLFDATGRSQGYRFPVLDPFATPGGVLVATTNGAAAANWNLEARVPWGVLGNQSHGSGDILGFDISLDDDDTGTRDRAVVWKNSSPGGCTCAMDPNPNPCEPYCHPRTFWRLQLGGR